MKFSTTIRLYRFAIPTGTATLLYVLMCLFVPVSLLLSPALFAFTLLENSMKNFSERLLLSVGAAIAWWVASYPMLKLFPVPTEFYIYIFSYVFILLASLRFSRFRSEFFVKDALLVGGAGMMIAVFLSLYSLQRVPAGADMATHTYAARVIAESRFFPKSFEPYVPISTFGFAPYGVSTVIGFISLLSGLETHRSAMLVTALEYPFIAFGLFLMLRRVAGGIPAAFITLFVLLVERNFVTYIPWGGNPTPFAVGFIAYGMAVLMLKESRQTAATRVLPAVFFAASLYTHPTPIAATAAFLGIYSIVIFFSKRRKLVPYIIPSIIWLMLTFPLLLSITDLSSVTMMRVKHDAQASYFGLSSRFPDILSSVATFITDRIGGRFLLLVWAGVFLGFAEAADVVLWSTAALLVAIALIINSVYWILPLSGVFYPDRVLTAAVLPFSIIAAVGVDRAYNAWRRSFLASKLLVALGTLPWAIFLGQYLVGQYGYIFNEVIVSQSMAQSSVTDHDLVVFDWIRHNTPPGTIIANNYGDAGVWIPAIAGRMVTWNDFDLHYKEELERRQAQLKPDYVFVGEKTVYHDGFTYETSVLSQDPRYSPVFRSGNAVLFKIINTGNTTPK